MSHQVVDLIVEYDQSLTRMDAEKDLQKQIAEKAHALHQLDAAAFKTAVAAYHAGKMQETLDQLCVRKSVLEDVMSYEGISI